MIAVKMPKYIEIINLLRGTAMMSDSYQNKWFSDETWVEIIKRHSPDIDLDYKRINVALARTSPYKDAIFLVTVRSTRQAFMPRRNLTEANTSGKFATISSKKKDRQLNNQTKEQFGGITSQSVFSQLVRKVQLLGFNHHQMYFHRSKQRQNNS